MVTPSLPFHDAVLELGSVPLPVVTARIDRFITEQGKGPYPNMESVGLGRFGGTTRWKSMTSATEVRFNFELAIRGRGDSIANQ